MLSKYGETRLKECQITGCPGNPTTGPTTGPATHVSRLGLSRVVGRAGRALHGWKGQVGAGSGGQRDRLGHEGQVKDLRRSSRRGQESLKSLEQGQDVVSLGDPSRIRQTRR